MRQLELHFYMESKRTNNPAGARSGTFSTAPPQFKTFLIGIFKHKLNKMLECLPPELYCWNVPGGGLYPAPLRLCVLPRLKMDLHPPGTPAAF